jgi:ubiquinone/menaquinone biosynthesis C-methylase UbiE
MARSASNKERSHWTISLLDIRRNDRLLEIGFGPGIAIELASKIAKEGFVAGVDHSAVMVQQASKRNAAAIREGRVELRFGSVSNLPTFDQPFDKIFTINSIHFWTDPIERLKELRALLRPGGMIAVVIQPRSRSATDTTARLVGEELVVDLEHAGFVNCRLEIKQIKPVSVACAIGTN